MQVVGLIFLLTLWPGFATASSSVTEPPPIELEWFDLKGLTKNLDWRTSCNWIWSKNVPAGLNLPVMPALEIWIEIPENITLYFTEHDLTEISASEKSPLPPLEKQANHALVKVETRSPKFTGQIQNLTVESKPIGLMVTVRNNSTKIFLHNSCKSMGVQLAGAPLANAPLFLGAFCESHKDSLLIKLFTSADAVFADSAAAGSQYQEISYLLHGLMKSESQTITEPLSLGIVHVMKKFDNVVSNYELNYSSTIPESINTLSSQSLEKQDDSQNKP